jgi:hypothetical protein
MDRFEWPTRLSVFATPDAGVAGDQRMKEERHVGTTPVYIHSLLSSHVLANLSRERSLATVARSGSL